MIPVSPAFLASIGVSHSMAVRARVCETYQTGTNPAGVEIPITGGQVTLDATADILGTLTLTTTRPWPSTTDTLLLPYGNEIFVERGIWIGQAVEWVPLGYYRVEGPDQDDAPDGPLVLEGSDRMAGIIDARLTSPRALPAALTYGAAVEDLVLDVYPAAVIEWDDPAAAARFLGRSVTLERDRYPGLRDLVKGLGKIVYWDHRGVLRIETPPAAGSPVWTVRHGDGGALVTLSRQLSRQGVYAGVVAEGESASDAPPVRAVRVDANPSSPTYWYGKFGKIPRFFSSPLLTTVAQCRAAADTELRKSLGLPYTVDLSMVPNPALRPWDPISVVYDDGHPAETHVIQRLDIPLTEAEAMTADTREQTVTIIGDL